MTEKDTQKIVCPQCDTIAEFEPTATIYPDSQALQMLMAGELNRVECAECGAVFVHPTPVVYRDDENRYMVYYLPEEICPDRDVALKSMTQMYDSIFNELPAAERPACRLVSKQTHFIEKITLVREDYDDRLIEYVKFILFENSAELDPEKIELLFDFTADNSKALNFIGFGRESHQAEYSMEFDLSDYAELEEFFQGSEQAAAKLEALYPPNLVSVDILIAMKQ